MGTKGMNYSWYNVIFHDRQLTAKDMQFLLENAGRILRSADMSEALVPGALSGGTLMGGSVLLLGDLMELWSRRQWTTTCPKCGEEAVLFGYGGSPLSGNGSGWGRCPHCGENVRVRYNAREAMKGMQYAGSHETIPYKGKKSFRSLTVFDVLDLLKKKKLKNKDLLDAIEEQDEEALKLLLKKGADVNEADRHGWTPLMSAVAMDDVECTLLLLEKGAKTDYRLNGETIVSFAARHGSYDTMPLLLEKGVDVNAKDNTGKSALLYAVEMGDTEIAEILLRNGADAADTDPEGRTALMLSVHSGNTETTKLLLDFNADTEKRTPQGDTTLIYAARGVLEETISKGAFLRLLKLNLPCSMDDLENFYASLKLSHKNKMDKKNSIYDKMLRRIKNRDLHHLN